ncbi:chromosome segregation ATPase [Nocardioides thalensis]|uniref:Chromosome segregation ATPase n=1 Tax=Nocardioides thalensis TaxID=1914755 RepID=A0A853BWX7_9ACTN|nr:chromosome segregation ATPase [Nocardioides thalensis]
MTPVNGSRRRQRSTRVAVAVLLLVLAAAAVAGAAVTGSWVAVTIAGAAAVLLGAVATKITHSELMASRRDAARDRAEQAQAFREVDERRSLEGVEFAADMQGRIAQREAVVSRLEGRLADAAAELAEARRQVTAEQERAETAEKETGRLAERLADAEERASDAVVRVAELEQEIDVLTAQWQAAEAALAEQNRMRKGA